MRVWGFCKLCEKRVVIIPGPNKPDSRQCYWYPVAHEDEDGKPCDGAKRGI